MKSKHTTKKKSLLFKNVLINLTIIVILIASIVFVLYRQSAKKITEEVEEIIQLKLIEGKGDIESIRYSQEQQLLILSKSTDALNILNRENTTEFEKQVNSLRDNYTEYLENVIVLDSTGRVVYDLENMITGQDLSERSYYQESIKGNVAHSELMVSKGSGYTVEVTSVPILQNSKVVGVLAVSMNVDYIKSALEAIKVEENGYAFLLDENGNFIYHPNKELLNANIADLGVAKLTEAFTKMQAGEEGRVSYTYEGFEKEVMYMPVGNWTLCVNAVKSEYLAQVHLMLKESIILGFIMLVLSSVATGYNSFLMIRKIKKVQDVMGVVSHGNMKVEVEENNLKKCWEVRQCGKTECPAYENDNLKCWEISRTLCNGVVQSDAMAKLENCKKCKVYAMSEGDEISQMSRGLSIMITTIRNLIRQISDISTQLSSSSEQLSSASEETTVSAESISERMEEMSSGAQTQTEYIENINSMAHVMNEKLTDSVNKINDMAQEASVVNKKAKVGEEKIEVAINGMEQIKTQTEKIEFVMNELLHQSAEIEEINNLITSIAEETNLLSLNASIEAARAGENGKGFGVVASEIGKLASQSQKSAKGISVLIEKITESIQSANELMKTETEFVQNGIISVQESRAAFEEIATTVYELVDDMTRVVSYVETVKDSSVSVTEAVEKMSSIIEESSADMEEITAATQEQTSVSEEISSSSADLAKMAEELLQAVSEFEV